MNAHAARPFLSLAATLLTALAAGLPASAQQAQWEQVRPGNTGIPGVQLHYGTISPEGKVWVAGRWPFWGEGGYGIYDPATDLWETLSNVDTPQPSQWAGQVIFAPGGVIWMATEDGLVRKEGETWTVYTTANAPLVHNKVRNIALAPNGDLWVNNSGVNTAAAAVFRLSGQTWMRYRVGEQIPFAPPWNQLGVVLVTPDGHAWVSNEALNGVAHFDGAAWTLLGEDVGRFGSGLVDHNGDPWFVAGVGGGNQFWRYRRAANQWDQFSPANTPFVNTTITRLGIDPQGRVYCGNWTGQVIRFENGSWTQVANVGDAVYGIGVEADGDMWIATLGNGQTGELHRLDASGNPIRRYNTWNTGMPDYFIDGMSVDRRGNLWVATGEAGLSRFDGQRWRNWGAHNSGSEPYPWAGNEPMGTYYEDAAGTGWMGGNGIGRWDRETGQFTGFWNWQNNPGIDTSLVTSFAEDGAGNLFAGSDSGRIYRFDGASWQFQPTPSAGGYTSDYAGVKADPQGRIWAMGWLRAYLWDGSAWAEVGQGWDIFGKGGVNCYDVGPDGSLWVGTNEGLLRVQNPPGGTTTFFTPANSPLPAKQVQGIDFRRGLQPPFGAPGDFAMAVSTHKFQSTTPFPTGVAVVQGDASVAANWRIYRYGQDPIRHYQLGPVKWDRDGNLWISAISEGCSVLLNTPSPPACYANCDGSTAAPVLNVADFGCFLTRYAAGEAWANCDESTAPPVLNVADFGCFLTRYAAGCP